MTLKEFKELVNNSYEVYTPTDDTDFDVFTLRAHTKPISVLIC